MLISVMKNIHNFIGLKLCGTDIAGSFLLILFRYKKGSITLDSIIFYKKILFSSIEYILNRPLCYLLGKHLDLVNFIKYS